MITERLNLLQVATVLGSLPRTLSRAVSCDFTYRPVTPQHWAGPWRAQVKLPHPGDPITITAYAKTFPGLLRELTMLLSEVA